MPRYLKVKKNKLGRDLVVGDIHGNYDLLTKKLDELSFDTSRDRLFCVGDLVDRGDKNLEVVSLIDNKVFFSVLGNHETLLLARLNGDKNIRYHTQNGGRWFDALDKYTKTALCNKLINLPYAIEIPIGGKNIGIVHAEVPNNDWSSFRRALKKGKSDGVFFEGVNGVSKSKKDKSLNICLWSRSLINNLIVKEFDINPQKMSSKECEALYKSCYNGVLAGKMNYQDKNFTIKGIDHVYVGHKVLPCYSVLGDYSYIDTGAYKSGRDLTVLNLTEIHSI